MAKSKPETATFTGGADQNIEHLRKRFDELNTRRIQADTQRKAAAEELDRLRQRALKDYQTDDLEQLRKKLRETIENNERLRTDYQRHLDGIESQLAGVEQKHRETGDGSEQRK